MIDIGVDKPGHALRALISDAVKPFAIAGLFELLRDKDVIVRSAAARELQVRGTSAVFHKAKELLNDSEDTVRELSAFVLGQLGTPKRPFRSQSITLLVDLLKKEESPSVITAGLASLAHLKAREVIETQLRFRQHAARDVRSSLAFAIGYANAPAKAPSNQALVVLQTLRRDQSRSVRDSAALALELIAGSTNKPGRRKSAAAEIGVGVK